MLNVELHRIPGHPEGQVYHLDFVNPSCPNGKPLNFRLQANVDELIALSEALDLILERGLNRVKVQAAPSGPKVLYPRDLSPVGLDSEKPEECES